MIFWLLVGITVVSSFNAIQKQKRAEEPLIPYWTQERDTIQIKYLKELRKERKQKKKLYVFNS